MADSVNNGGSDGAPSVDSAGIRVFVYGTLKKGHPNHGLLRDSDFLGRCRISGRMRMVDLGYYPGVVPATGRDATDIFGEVYRIRPEVLDTLDVLEGHPAYYERKRVPTPWKGAWCYLLPAEYAEKNDVLQSGMWDPTEEEEQYWREHNENGGDIDGAESQNTGS